MWRVIVPRPVLPVPMKGLADVFGTLRRPQERTVRDVLTELGLSPEEIEQAEADETDELMALDGLVLPEPGRFSVEEVAEISGLDAEVVQAVWRGFGFAEVVDGERVFTHRDRDMFVRFADAVQRGVIEPARSLQLVRVLGVSMAQFATAVVDSMEGRSAERRRAAAEAEEPPQPVHDAGSIAVQAGTLLPMMTDALDYAFQRHLKNAAQHRIALASSLSGDRQAVGFADLVNFTTVAEDLDERGLGELMDRFDTITHEVVIRHGGRIVKMIGDECMFTLLRPDDAARTGLELARRLAGDRSVPGVRVGLSYGQVLSRDGDLYGPTVNLASRLVQLGVPGSVHISRELRDAIEGNPAFTARSAGVRRLRHIGARRIYRLKKGPAWGVPPATGGEDDDDGDEDGAGRASTDP